MLTPRNVMSVAGRALLFAAAVGLWLAGLVTIAHFAIKFW